MLLKHELNQNKQFGPKQKESTKDQDLGCFIFFSFKQKAVIQISALMSRKEILFKNNDNLPKQTQHMPCFNQTLQFAYLLISFFLITLQGQDIPLSYFVIMCKTYKDVETKTHKKAKKAKVQETASALNFINVEDEVFLKVRIEQFISGQRNSLAASD